MFAIKFKGQVIICPDLKAAKQIQAALFVSKAVCKSFNNDAEEMSNWTVDTLGVEPAKQLLDELTPIKADIFQDFEHGRN